MYLKNFTMTFNTPNKILRATAAVKLQLTTSPIKYITLFNKQTVLCNLQVFLHF